MKSIAIALAAMLMTAPALADDEMMVMTQPTLACGDSFNLMMVTQQTYKLAKQHKDAEAREVIDEAVALGLCQRMAVGDHLYYIQKNPDRGMTVAWMPVGVMKFALWVLNGTYVTQGN